MSDIVTSLTCTIKWRISNGLLQDRYECCNEFLFINRLAKSVVNAECCEMSLSLQNEFQAEKKRKRYSHFQPRREQQTKSAQLGAKRIQCLTAYNMLWISAWMTAQCSGPTSQSHQRVSVEKNRLPVMRKNLRLLMTSWERQRWTRRKQKHPDPDRSIPFAASDSLLWHLLLIVFAIRSVRVKILVSAAAEVDVGDVLLIKGISSAKRSRVDFLWLQAVTSLWNCPVALS